MKIEVILNEQTPEATEIKNPKKWLEDNKELIQEIKDYLDTCSTAIGIASNQMSIDGKRSMDKFFIHVGSESGDWELILNPKAEGLGTTDLRIESCLTWPKKYVVAERHRRINVDYYNENGEHLTKEIRGYESHVWQHEIAHLEGIEERIEGPNKKFDARLMPKTQRNEDCPCGSGKKYKKCCAPFEIVSTNISRSDRLTEKVNEAFKKEVEEG